MTYFTKLRNSINKSSEHAYAPDVVIGNSIPKVVHQTYFSKNLPSEIQNNIDQLKIANPDWDFKLYDDADIKNYIEIHFPSLLKTYLKINPIYGAARADFFRYLLVYNEGGVYLDIKSSISKPFNEIILEDDKYLLSHWPNDKGQDFYTAGITKDIPHPFGELQQWHIISIKGHPFLKAVINNVCNNIMLYNPLIHHTGRWGVMTLTGPVAYSNAILPILDLHQHRLVRSHNLLNLVYSIYSSNISVKHHHIYKNHYTALNESVVKLSFRNEIAFKLLQPLKDMLVTILKKIRTVNF